MAFSNYTDPSQTFASLGIAYARADLLATAAPKQAPDWLAHLLSWHISRLKRPFSEMYARENLIAPLFSFTLMQAERLNLFSNEYYLEGPTPRPELPPLSGVPDYLISYPKRPGLLDLRSQFPLLVVAEAKNETFNAGWAQCAAELYVCQRLNEQAGTNGGVPLWGIVTNGLLWEFGNLEGEALTIHHRSLDADPLEKLLGALDYIFADCVKNGEQMADAAA